MYGLSLAFVAATAAGVDLSVLVDRDPPLIAKMEELGTVYVTRHQVRFARERFVPAVPPGARRGGGPQPQIPRNAIVGIDFRPMAGSDPEKVAALLKELEGFRHLHTVLLLGQDFHDSAIEALPASVTTVTLFNTRVTDKGIAKLSRFKNLNGFHYTGTLLSDAGLKEIAKRTTLQALTIRDAKVTDKGVDALASLENLRRLTIENSAASQTAINRLQLTIPSLFERDFRSI